MGVAMRLGLAVVVLGAVCAFALACSKETKAPEPLVATASALSAVDAIARVTQQLCPNSPLSIGRFTAQRNGADWRVLNSQFGESFTVDGRSGAVTADNDAAREWAADLKNLPDC